VDSHERHLVKAHFPQNLDTHSSSAEYRAKSARHFPYEEIYKSGCPGCPGCSFFYRVVDAQVTFVKDPGGQVTGLILHQGGRDAPGKKVK
jgi:hypothetical protein